MVFRPIKIFNKAIKFVRTEIEGAASGKLTLSNIKIAFERSKVGKIIAECRGKSLPEIADITSKSDKFNKETLIEKAKPEVSDKLFIELRDKFKDYLTQKDIDENLLDDIMASTNKENIEDKVALYKQFKGKLGLKIDRVGTALVGDYVPEYKLAYKIMHRNYLTDAGPKLFDKRMDVRELFKTLNSENKDLVELCIDRKDIEGYLDSAQDIARLVSEKRPFNEEFIKKALLRKGADGYFVDSAYEVRSALSTYIKSDMLEYCLNKKDSKGNFVHGVQEVSEIADIYSQHSDDKFFQKTLKYLVDRPEEFSSLEISDFASLIQSEKHFNRLKELLGSEKLSSHQLVKALKSKNYSIIPEISFYKDFASEIKSESDLLPNCPEKKSRMYKNIVSSLYELKQKSPDRFNKLCDSGLLDMIDSGKLKVATLKGLTRSENNFVSHNLLNDARKVKLNEPLVKSFSDQISVSNFIDLVPNGEVASCGKNLYANDAGRLERLKLSKEKFEDLFPLVERFSTTQGADLGDCWLVSSLASLMDKSNTRIKLYKLFHQVGNDIVIKFPDSKSQILFKDGNVIDNANRQISGSKGMKMLEQAFSIHRYDDYIAPLSEISQYTDIKTQMEKLESGFFRTGIESLLGKDNIAKSSCIPVDNIFMRDYIKNEIELYSKVPRAIFEFGFSRAVNNAKFAKTYNLSSQHSYFLNSYDAKDGLCYITNPHNAGIITEIPLYSLLRYLNQAELVGLA